MRSQHEHLLYDLIGYYAKGKLWTVDGVDDIETISDEIKGLLRL